MTERDAMPEIILFDVGGVLVELGKPIPPITITRSSRLGEAERNLVTASPKRSAPTTG